MVTSWTFGASKPRIYLRALDKAAIDITDIISKIDPKLLEHFWTVLSRPGMSLNGRGYELVHFIAANNALSMKGEIVGRVIAGYEQLWPADPNKPEKKTNTWSDLLEPEEELFLEGVLNQTRGNATYVIPTKEDFELIKIKMLFGLWNEDRGRNDSHGR